MFVFSHNIFMFEEKCDQISKQGVRDSAEGHLQIARNGLAHSELPLIYFLRLRAYR